MSTSIPEIWDKSSKRLVSLKVLGRELVLNPETYFFIQISFLITQPLTTSLQALKNNNKQNKRIIHQINIFLLVILLPVSQNRFLKLWSIIYLDEISKISISLCIYPSNSSTIYNLYMISLSTWRLSARSVLKWSCAGRPPSLATSPYLIYKVSSSVL